MQKLPSLFFVIALAAAVPAHAQEYTEAGTRLSVGESAVVPYSIANGPEVPVELTITAIEEGAKADLEGYEIPESLENARPIYVRFTYTNLSDEDLSNMTLGAFVGIDDRDQGHMPDTASSFDKCRTEIARDLTNGKSHEGCVMFMIHETGDLAAAGYRGRTRQDKETPVYSDPILWVPTEAVEDASETDDENAGTVTAF